MKIRIGLVGIGLLLLMMGLFYCMTMSMNVGNLMPCFVGATLCVWGRFYPLWLTHTNKGAGRWLRMGVTGGLVVVGLLFGLMWGATMIRARFIPAPDKDVIIVLGAGLRGKTVSPSLARRLDTGYGYWIDNTDALFLVTGGQGPGEWVTEASAMKTYLVDKGVPASQILTEDKSTSTRENFTFSKPILVDYFKRPYTSVYVTNDFHILRAGFYAHKAGESTDCLAASTPWYMLPNVYSREFLAVAWYFAFEQWR